jgi:hypothetical protein
LKFELAEKLENICEKVIYSLDIDTELYSKFDSNYFRASAMENLLA